MEKFAEDKENCIYRDLSFVRKWYLPQKLGSLLPFISKEKKGLI